MSDTLEGRGQYPGEVDLNLILYVDKLGGTPTEDGYITLLQYKQLLDKSNLQRTVSIASPDAIVITDGTVLLDSTSNTISIELPPASDGKVKIPFKDVGCNSSINSITFTVNGSDTITDINKLQTSTEILSDGFSGYWLSNGVDTWYLF